MTTTPLAWLAPFDADFSTLGAQSEHRILGLANGQFVVLFNDTGDTTSTTSGTDIVGTLFNADGTPAGAQRQFNFNYAVDDEHFPAVAATTGSAFAMAYVDHNTTFDSHNLRLEFVDAALPTSGAVTVQLDEGGNVVLGQPSIAVSPVDGSIYVVWTRTDGVDVSIRGALLTSSGEIDGDMAFGGEVLFSGLAPGFQTPDVGVTADGNFYVVAEDSSSAVGVAYVEIAVDYADPNFPDGAATVGAPISLTGSTGDNSDIEPRIAGLSGGGFVAVWTDPWRIEDPVDPDDHDVWFNIVAADGTVSVIDYFDFSTDDVKQPDVIGLADGGFYIVALRANSGVLVGQRYDAAGNTIGDAQHIIVDEGLSNARPELSLTADGRILVAWQGAPEIRAMILDPRDTASIAAAVDDGISQYTAQAAGAATGTDFTGTSLPETFYGFDGADGVTDLLGGRDRFFGYAGIDFATFAARPEGVEFHGGADDDFLVLLEGTWENSTFDGGADEDHLVGGFANAGGVIDLTAATITGFERLGLAASTGFSDLPGAKLIITDQQLVDGFSSNLVLFDNPSETLGYRLQIQKTGAIGLDLSLWDLTDWKTEAGVIEILGSEDAETIIAPDAQVEIALAGGDDTLEITYERALNATVLDGGDGVNDTLVLELTAPGNSPRLDFDDFAGISGWERIEITSDDPARDYPSIDIDGAQVLSGAFGPNMVFDFSAFSPASTQFYLNLDDSAASESFDFSGWSLVGSGDGRVRYYLTPGQSVIGFDLHEEFLDVNGGDYEGRGGFDRFDIDGAATVLAPTFIDGGDDHDTVNVYNDSGVPRTIDLRNLALLDVEEMSFEGDADMRVLVDVENVDAPGGFTLNADFLFGALTAELYATDTPDLNLSDLTVYGNVALEVFGGGDDQVFTLNDTDADLAAGGGDDMVNILSGGSGTHSVDGEAGYDTVFFDGPAADYALTGIAGGWNVSHAGDGLSVDLFNVERLFFADIDLFLDPGEVRLTEFSPIAYDPAEDQGSTVVIPAAEPADPGLLQLSGNDWAALALRKTITANTVLRFTVEAPALGEALAIGFDDDLTASPNWLFQLAGTDVLGLQDFALLDDPTDGPVTYEIPVGAFFQGDFNYMVFANDDDAGGAGSVAESIWSEIELFERAPLAVDGALLPLLPYDEAGGGAAEISPDGGAVTLTDAVRAVAVNQAVTRNTWLSFTYESDSTVGGFHGIGFDDDLDSDNGVTAFQLQGDELFGEQGFNDYAPGEGPRQYLINLGAYMPSGTYANMVLAVPDGDGETGGFMGTFSGIDFFENPTLNVNGVGRLFSSYGAGQDHGTGDVSPGGTTVTLADNAWKRAVVDYTIGNDTWLAFDYFSDAEGEVHAIGFDNDDAPSASTVFQLQGEDSYGIQDFRSYSVGDGWTRYLIEVGNYFTGTFENLVMLVDDDNGGEGNGTFANIEIFEGPVFHLLGNPVELQPYGAGQDAGDATVITSDLFNITGNAWKKAAFGQEITADTWITFRYDELVEGEFHGFGFDNDDAPSLGQIFQLGGTDTAGIQDAYGSEYGDDFNRIIHVGAHMTGLFENMVFVVDDDATGLGSADFSRVIIRQGPFVDPGTTGLFIPTAFGAGQDHGTVTGLPGGSGLTIADNAWKKVTLHREISAGTVLSFDYFSDAEGEVQGIGFAHSDAPTASTLFQLQGTDKYGIQNFNSYDVGDGWVHYDIQVGSYFTGFFEYITFVADDDAGGEGTASFRDFEFTDLDDELLISGVPFAPTGYGGTQDQGFVETLPDGSAVTLSGNAWKSVPVDITVTPDTWLIFDFEIDALGEVHGIGFDDDAVPTISRIFQLGGEDGGVGVQDFNTYAIGDGLVRYEINVGDYYTGDFDRLFFVNDDDVTPVSESSFHNIEIYQAPMELVLDAYGGPATGAAVEEWNAPGTLRLFDNALRSVDMGALEVDANTMLHFEFRADEEGEVHGIGIDNNDGISGGLFWQLFGVQEPSGLQTHNGIYSAGDGWVAYDIAVGAEVAAGTYDRLTLLMDSDGAGAPGDSTFRNITFSGLGAGDESMDIFGNLF